jgi:hypothetical protein
MLEIAVPGCVAGLTPPWGFGTWPSFGWLHLSPGSPLRSIGRRVLRVSEARQAYS